MIKLLLGDCLDILPTLPDCSVDSMVTDPPAGISFMGKEWDSHKGGRDEWIAWLTSVMKEAFRVMKPGAHGLVWALPRTSHWTGVALENAGFDVSNGPMAHVFGTGFPKNHAIGKAIDRQAGAVREAVGVNSTFRSNKEAHANAIMNPMRDGEAAVISLPATEDAETWDGFGTALKPAMELWWICQKPIERRLTIAANVLKWGCGGLAIDKSRITCVPFSTSRNVSLGNSGSGVYGKTKDEHVESDSHPSGRWPANFILSHVGPDEHGNGGCVRVGEKRVKPSNGSGIAGRGNGVTNDAGIFGGNIGKLPEGIANLGYADPDGLETVEAWQCAEGCPIAEMDRQSGVTAPGAYPQHAARREGREIYGDYGERHSDSRIETQAGGASRFFLNLPPPTPEELAWAEHMAATEARLAKAPPFRYQAKPSTSERNEGCENLPLRRGSSEVFDPKNRDGVGDERMPMQRNVHPTVKSTALMRYLIGLITPPGGKVLDMFGGSGTTHVAAQTDNFEGIYIEREPEYFAIGSARINNVPLSLFDRQ